MTTRAATIADSPAAAAVIRACFEQYRGVLVPESGGLAETEDSLTSKLEQGATILLAERHGLLIGCVVAKPVHGEMYFGRLAVLPQAQGSGVARALVAAVEDEAIRRGETGVWLGVRIALPENRRYFASLGYREVSRETHAGFDHPTWIRMRKPLCDVSPG